MPLLDCNEDVLRLILDCLGPAPLAVVCRVHPYLRHLAEPVLYSTVDLTFHGDKLPPVDLFLRTILQRPDLAARVRNLSLSGTHPHILRFPGHVPKPLPDVSGREAAIAFIVDTQLPYREQWIEGLLDGALDAYMALVLSQLPRLRALRLGCYYKPSGRGLLGAVLRAMAGVDGPDSDSSIPGIQARLDQLQSFSLDPDVHHHQRRTRWNTEDVFSLFYVPAVRELSIFVRDKLLAESEVPWPVATPPSARELVSLRIMGIRESQLRHVLSATPALRSLQWLWSFSSKTRGAVSSPVVNLGHVMSALSHVKDTLGKLVVFTAAHESSSISSQLSVQGSLRPLAAFEHVRKLVMPMVFFTGFTLPARQGLGRCLPCNLEELKLTDQLFDRVQDRVEWGEGRVMAREICAYLEQVESFTPRLRKLVLQLQISRWHDRPLPGMDIRELAGRAGIEFQVVRPRLWPH